MYVCIYTSIFTNIYISFTVRLVPLTFAAVAENPALVVKTAAV